MWDLDPQLAKALVDRRAEQMIYQVGYPVATRVRPHQAGAKSGGWLAWQSCRLLARLGGQLVALGERLERYGLPQPSHQQARQ